MLRLKSIAAAILLVLMASQAIALDPTTLEPIEMAGNLQFLRKAGTIDVYCGQIASYRPDYIMSGTLVIQLWAATSSTSTPSTAQFKMCEMQVGKLQGHHYIQNVRRTGTFKAPAPGTYYVIFALAEWNGTKYVPIDWYTFSNPKTFSTTRRFQAASERIPGT
jgi:hypothetical protein